MSIEILYQQKLQDDKWGDMIPRMADLRRYAGMVSTVVEFGVRTGNSTTAFLAGGASVTSYDIEEPQFIPPDDVKHKWSFKIANTANLLGIPETDLLFIDTRHTQTQVERELVHAGKVRKYILLHDIIVNGWTGDGNEPGIGYAVLDFLRLNDRHWHIAEFLIDKFGLLVLERHA